MKRILGFMCISLMLVPAVTAAKDSTPDVHAALKDWVAAVESHDAERVVNLYDENSMMLSAFAIHPLTTHKELLDYYKKVVAEPNVHITVTKEDVRQFGNVAVNTGLYRFHWTQDGEPMDDPARFSFVYVLKDGKWVIISHHSSIVPGSGKTNNESTE